MSTPPISEAERRIGKALGLTDEQILRARDVSLGHPFAEPDAATLTKIERVVQKASGLPAARIVASRVRRPLADHVEEQQPVGSRAYRSRESLCIKCSCNQDPACECTRCHFPHLDPDGPERLERYSSHGAGIALGDRIACCRCGCVAVVGNTCQCDCHVVASSAKPIPQPRVKPTRDTPRTQTMKGGASAITAEERTMQRFSGLTDEQIIRSRAAALSRDGAVDLDMSARRKGVRIVAEADRVCTESGLVRGASGGWLFPQSLIQELRSFQGL